MANGKNSDININRFEDLKAVKGLRITHLNIRSLVKKIDQLRVLLFDAGIDILTISETWLMEHLQTKLFEIEGYDTHRLDRLVPRKAGGSRRVTARARGGGLVIYVSTKYSSLCEELTDLQTSNENIEAQWILLHRAHCKDVVICNVYRPPMGDVQKAVKYLDDCLKTINTAKTDVFILGDMNINFKNKSSPNFKKLNFFSQSNGLSQHITSTTRKRQNQDTTRCRLLKFQIYQCFRDPQPLHK